MADRQVRIIISGEAASLIRAAGQAEGALRQVGQTGDRAAEQSSSFGDKLKKGLEVAGVTLGLAGVAAGIKYVVTQGTSFQDNMNSLQAVTGASAGQMDRLSGTARALGKNIDLPATSAGDAAEAMLELAKGGLSVNESMAAAKGTLLLAAAASVSGADAATIQANALNAFALSGDQANHVADVLANTASAASGDITDFAAGLQQSATVAHAFGIGIEDSATTLGLFAKAGLSGSDAGTSFKTMLTALASPTKQQQIALDELNLTVYDAQGNFVGMKSITEQLAAAKGNLTQQEYNAAASTAFGSDAIRAANILAEGGVGAWNDMAAAVGKAGGAQELAAAKTQGVSGAFGKMMSAVEDVALTLFNQFAPALEGSLNFAGDLVNVIGNVVTFVGNLPGPVLAGAAAFGTFLLLRGPLNTLFLQAVAGYVRLGNAAVGAAASARAAGISMATFGAVAKGALAALGGPLGIALTAGAVALAFFSGSSDDAAGSTADFTGAIDENTGALSANAPAVIAAASAKSGAFAAYKSIGGSVKEYTDALLGNTSAQDELHTRLLDTATAAIKGSNEWGRYVASGQSAGKSAREVASDILASGDAGQFASDGLNAALTASALYASESDKLGTEAEQTNDVLAATGGAGANAAGGLGDAAGAAGDAGAAAADAKSPMDLLKAATDDLGSAAAYADSATQFLTASLDAASGNAISQEQATRLNESAFRGIGAAARDYAAAQDDVTAAAIGVRDAQAKVDEVTKNLGKSQDEGGTTADDLTTAQLALADANRTNDAATGKVADATDRQFDANLKAQQSALDLATSAYATASANGDLKGAADAANAVIEVQRSRFIDAQIAAGMEEDAARDLATKLFGIPGAVGTKISETGGDAVKLQAQQVKARLSEIPTQFTSFLEFRTNLDSQLASIRANLNSIPDNTIKRVTIETNNLVYTTTSGAKMQADGGVVMPHAAMGRVVAGRGESMVADGSGPGLTWAEAATNKEYYLSMKSGMESRNRGLASDAVKELGGQAVWGPPVRSSAGVGAGTMTAGGSSQPINLTLTLLGDGPITEAALQAAHATVENSLRDVRLLVNRAGGQG